MSTERTRWIGVSTKMYLGYQRSLDWMTAVAAIADERPGLAEAGITPFVIPSFPVLESALRILGPAGVVVGAQAVSQDEGAATGEVGAGLLAEMGVQLVEIGHAERRARYGETDEVVAAKTKAAIAAGLTPLLCVGEESGDDPEGAVRIVVEQCLAAVGDAALLDRIVVAYEPVWAIGAPAPAGAGYVNQVVAGIREALEGLLGGPAPAIVYGGSAGPGLLPTLPEVDGLFLGRFAHDPANFGLVLDEALAL